MLVAILIMCSCTGSRNEGDVTGMSEVSQFTVDEVYQCLDSAQQAFIDTVFTEDEKAVYLESIKNNLIMMDYIEANGDSLKITISKEDAVAKGVPEQYYDQALMELQFVNNSPLPGAAEKMAEAKKEMAALKARIEAARKK